MKASIDRSLLLVVIFLMGLGLVQVYSSSFIFAIESFDDGLFFFRKQLLFAVLGVFVLLFVAYTPWRWIQSFGFLIAIVAAIGVAATLVPGWGVRVGGAARWLELPFGFRFEPSELYRVSFPLLIGLVFAYKQEFLGRLKWPLWAFLVLAPLFLLLKQPDFGSFAIVSAIFLGLLFCFGLQWRYIVAATATASLAFYFLIINVPYRAARMVGFLDPWSDPEQKGFQVIQSMLSFHSGGFWGVGLGQGQGKLFFLPEAHTDFTFAILGEELGFLGVLFVLVLYGYVILRGLQIAARSQELYPQVVALGITLALGLSVFINIGVTMGMLPTKGLALPFLSYGGSSLISSVFAIGILLNIDRYNSRLKSRDRQNKLNKIRSFSGINI